MTVLLCGIPSERPLAMVAGELEALGVPYVAFSQRRVASCAIELEVAEGAVGGLLRLDTVTLPLPRVRGAYTRLMDDAGLPELRGLAAGAPEREHSRRFHNALVQWLEIAPAVVVNRAAPQGSNASKPYQAQLIAAAGLRVPETLVTSDPAAVHEFRERHGRVVYKSISGARSIVRELVDEDLRRLDAIRWCPVQFQAYVEGDDVRVHCVGEEVHATRIRSGSTDYRYSEGDAALEAIELADELAERCAAVTAALGLELSGIDLRLTPDGEACCFEVNPSPAFSYYESATGQPIARAIARRLARAEPSAVALSWAPERSGCTGGAPPSPPGSAPWPARWRPRPR